MKLIDVLGRLLLLALRKAGSPARFCVAAGAVASLAGAVRPSLEGAGGGCCMELGQRGSSCLRAGASLLHDGPCELHTARAAACCPAESALASQTAGSTRHGSSADMDRVCLGQCYGWLRCCSWVHFEAQQRGWHLVVRRSCGSLQPWQRSLRRASARRPSMATLRCLAPHWPPHWCRCWACWRASWGGWWRAACGPQSAAPSSRRCCTCRCGWGCWDRSEFR